MDSSAHHSQATPSSRIVFHTLAPARMLAYLEKHPLTNPNLPTATEWLQLINNVNVSGRIDPKDVDEAIRAPSSLEAKERIQLFLMTLDTEINQISSLVMIYNEVHGEAQTRLLYQLLKILKLWLEVAPYTANTANTANTDGKLYITQNDIKATRRPAVADLFAKVSTLLAKRIQCPLSSLENRAKEILEPPQRVVTPPIPPKPYTQQPYSTAPPPLPPRSSSYQPTTSLTFAHTLPQYSILPHKLVKDKMQLKNKRLEYLSEEQVERFRLQFRSGRLMQYHWWQSEPDAFKRVQNMIFRTSHSHISTGQLSLVLAESKNMASSNAQSFHAESVSDFCGCIMSTSGIFYAAQHLEFSRGYSITNFYHSSYLSGANVAFAGIIKIVRGKVLAICNDSGHYQPDRTSLASALRVMQSNGVNINIIEVFAVNPKTSKHEAIGMGNDVILQYSISQPQSALPKGNAQDGWII